MLCHVNLTALMSFVGLIQFTVPTLGKCHMHGYKVLAQLIGPTYKSWMCVSLSIASANVRDNYGEKEMLCKMWTAVDEMLVSKLVYCSKWPIILAVAEQHIARSRYRHLNVVQC